MEERPFDARRALDEVIGKRWNAPRGPAAGIAFKWIAGVVVAAAVCAVTVFVLEMSRPRVHPAPAKPVVVHIVPPKAEQ